MAAFVQHVRILHGGAEIFVTEQFLDRPAAVPGLKKMRGERVLECVNNIMCQELFPVDCVPSALSSCSKNGS